MSKYKMDTFDWWGALITTRLLYLVFCGLMYLVISRDDWNSLPQFMLSLLGLLVLIEVLKWVGRHDLRKELENK